jgi:hypothetical protein
MDVESKPVKVICPTCNKETKINIPVFIVQDALEGVANIQVPVGACCPDHAFMAYVDKRFKVRGYSKVDVEFRSGGKNKPIELMEADDVTGYAFGDMIDLIGPDICATIVRAILAGVSIYLLDTFDLYNRIDKTVSLLQDTCIDELAITIEKITKEALDDKSRLNRNAIVCVPLYGAITRSPFRDTINTRFESNLLGETIKLPDRASQIVFLRKELVKIKTIIEDFVQILQKTDKFYEEDVSPLLKNKFNVKFDAKNVDVIRDVIAFTHDKKMAEKIVSKYADFLT